MLAPPRGLVPPPRGNIGSATDLLPIIALAASRNKCLGAGEGAFRRFGETLWLVCDNKVGN